MTTDIPFTRAPDTTISLLRDGYAFISKRCGRFHSDAFATRLLGRPVVCLTGRDAAELVYDPDRFQRAGAAPDRVLKTLFGRGGVQSFDDRAHQWRQGMFMSLMTRERMDAMLDLVAYEWQTALTHWSKVDRTVLHAELQVLLCRAACEWSGLPVSSTENRKLAADLGHLVHGFGSLGPRWRRARNARLRAEAWARRSIADLREGTLESKPETAAFVIASHRDHEGNLLEEREAAVELLNVLRPIVAIATYITFSALALHDHPRYQAAIRKDDALLEPFIQEVRRFYPFTPFVGAIARKQFTWRGIPFPRGRRVLLDVYGVNHDHRLWQDPDTFRPERFVDYSPDAFSFPPQAAGDHSAGHRGAGEWLTIAMMRLALHFLVRRMAYSVPEQDLSYDLSHIPTLPASGFVVRDVEAARAAPRARLSIVAQRDSNGQHRTAQWRAVGGDEP